MRNLASACGHLREVGQQPMAVVVEVADQRDVVAEQVEPLADQRHGARRVVVVDGDPHDLGAGAGELDHLARGGGRRRRCRCWSSTGRRPAHRRRWRSCRRAPRGCGAASARVNATMAELDSEPRSGPAAYGAAARRPQASAACGAAAAGARLGVSGRSRTTAPGCAGQPDAVAVDQDLDAAGIAGRQRQIRRGRAGEAVAGLPGCACARSCRSALRTWTQLLRAGQRARRGRPRRRRRESAQAGLAVERGERPAAARRRGALGRRGAGDVDGRRRRLRRQRQRRPSRARRPAADRRQPAAAGSPRPVGGTMMERARQPHSARQEQRGGRKRSATAARPRSRDRRPAPASPPRPLASAAAPAAVPSRPRWSRVAAQEARWRRRGPASRRGRPLSSAAR